MNQETKTTHGQWIKLFRDILDSTLWTRSHKTFKIGIYLMLRARYTEEYRRGVLVKPGQCMCTNREIAEDCQLRPKTTEGALQRLIDDDFILSELPGGPTRGRLITVKHFLEFQNCNSGNWVKLHRDLIGSKLWSSPDAAFRVGLYLILIANHEPGHFYNIPIQTGQTVRSLTRIAEDCCITRKAARYSRDLLRRDGFITIDKPNGAQHGHRITICNYRAYQNTEERQREKQGTGSPTIGPTQLPTNKKGRMEEGKNEKNMAAAESAPATAGAVRGGARTMSPSLFPQTTEDFWKPERIPTPDWSTEDYVTEYQDISAALESIPSCNADSLRNTIETQPDPFWRCQGFLDWKCDFLGSTPPPAISKPAKLLSEYMKTVENNPAHPLIHSENYNIASIGEEFVPIFPRVCWQDEDYQKSLAKLKTQHPTVPETVWSEVEKKLFDYKIGGERAEQYAEFLKRFYHKIAKTDPSQLSEPRVAYANLSDCDYMWYHGLEEGYTYNDLVEAKMFDAKYWGLDDFVAFVLDLRLCNPPMEIPGLYPPALRYSLTFQQEYVAWFDVLQDLFRAIFEQETPEIRDFLKLLRTYCQQGSSLEEEE